MKGFLEETKAAIELCKRVDEAELSIPQIRGAQDLWDALDGKALRKFFQERLEAHPDSAKHLYLYGRLVKETAEGLEIARRVIDLDPDSNWGFRLLMNIYSGCLFRKECHRRDQERLAAEIQKDAHFFERVYELTPESGQLLGYVFEYYLYRQKSDMAKLVLKKARKLEQEWAFDQDSILYQIANSGNHKKLKRKVAALTRDRIMQGYGKYSEMENLVLQNLIHYYRFGFAFEGGLLMLSQWLEKADSDHMRADIYFNMARFYSLLGHDDEAFSSLQKAGELGFGDPQRAEMHNCLAVLREDARWKNAIKLFRDNWAYDMERRKRGALATKVNLIAPDFALPNEDGNIVDLSTLSGNIIILEFWATDCKMCQRGLPELAEFTQHDIGPKIHFFSVNIRKENRQQAVAFKEKRGYKTRVLFANNDVARAYTVKSVPVLIVIDPQGHIRYREDGFHIGIRERLNWWIEDLFKEFSLGKRTRL